MVDEPDVDDERAARRAELLPEEDAVGSEDPEGQAAQILAESDERTADRDRAPSTHLEHRTSQEVAQDPG